MKKLLAAFAVFVLIVPGLALARSSAEHKFAKGQWKGDATIKSTISKDYMTGHSIGGLEFNLTATAAQVSGTLSYHEHIWGTIKGKAVTGNVTGHFRIAGTPDNVEAHGTLHIVEHYMGHTFPSTRAASGHFISIEGTCVVLRGDLGEQKKTDQVAHGFSTDLTGEWTAHRVDAGPKTC